MKQKIRLKMGIKLGQKGKANGGGCRTIITVFLRAKRAGRVNEDEFNE